VPDQIVEITQPGHYLSKHRGFLTVHSKGEQIGQVPLDDILAVLISVPGCSVSTMLIDQLCQRNIPLVICGMSYLPSCYTLPVQGYGHQFQVMRAQAELSQPQRKRAWQQIIRAKLQNQAEVLACAGHSPASLKRLANKVKSGDPENCEAQGARLYWQKLFGSEFRRDQNGIGLNAALNYAYAIVRGCVARGIAGAGLHPTFSIHHKNPHNPVNLIDDLMEPFRPIADYLIWQHGYAEDVELTPEIKKRLAAIVSLPVPLTDGASPLSLATVKVCRSFANYCLGQDSVCLLPGLPTSLSVAAL